jgi:hypothetical protein
LDFHPSWESSVQRALYGHRGSGRDDWSYAIRETREVWRSAYLVERASQLRRW